MPISKRTVMLTALAGAALAAVWVAGKEPMPVSMAAQENVLGIEWQTSTSPMTNPVPPATPITVPPPPTTTGGSSGGLGVEWQGGNSTTEPAAPTGGSGGLDVQWQGGNTKPQPPAPTGGSGGLAMEWQVKPSGSSATGGATGGLNLEWQGSEKPQPTGGEPVPLDVIWTGAQRDAHQSKLVREAFWVAYGRDPTASELQNDVNTTKNDGRYQTVAGLVERYRQRTVNSVIDQEMVANQALKNAWGAFSIALPNPYVAQFGLRKPGLLYAEQLPRTVVWLGYYRALGRYPTTTEFAQWEGVAATDPRLASVEAFAAELRAVIKRDGTARALLIDEAHQAVFKRKATAAEQARLSAELAQSGALWGELAVKLAGGADPMLPGKPVIVKTQNTADATQVIFRQSGALVERFVVERFSQWDGTVYWHELGSLNAGKDGQELLFRDKLEPNRITYRVCGVSSFGRTCSDPYQSTSRPVTPELGTNGIKSNATTVDLSVATAEDESAELILQRQQGGNWVDVKREPRAAGSRRIYFSYTATVPNGSTHLFRACARNLSGESCTAPATVKTVDGTAAPPTGLTARALNYTDWELTWSVRVYNEHKLRLEQWNIQGNRWEALATLGAYETKYQVKNTGDAPWYQYRICTSNQYGERCSDSVRVGKQFDHPSNFTSLDWGIYWFRCGTCRDSTRPSDKGYTSDGVKHVPGLPLEYFDPAKPTVIYVHGWEKGSTEAGARESMKSPTDGGDMMKAWRDAGWNVGVFYWNQFADDDWGLQPRTTEGKIDTQPISYRIKNGKGEAVDNGDRIRYPASQLFYMAYVDAMRGFKGPEIRIVGHSLGTQMATMMTHLVSQSSEYRDLTPHRVALLDPWVSTDGRGDALSGLMRGVSQNRGTVWELYQSSGISQYPGSWQRQALFTRVHPMYADWFGGAHAAAIHWYFGSMAGQPLKVTNGGPTNTAPSAAMSTGTLKSLSGCQCRFEQEAGKDSMELKDDTFVRHNL